MILFYCPITKSFENLKIPQYRSIHFTHINIKVLIFSHLYRFQEFNIWNKMRFYWKHVGYLWLWNCETWWELLSFMFCPQFSSFQLYRWAFVMLGHWDHLQGFKGYNFPKNLFKFLKDMIFQKTNLIVKIDLQFWTQMSLALNVRG
jgi:hypothetical protein